ncbi:bifunctional helix-turn-helix transcriptional regulator/GNAT family N-acetyltransferase [Solirhodobacter olei]|uniref:bifunctional helix-turn-helix transcriptional regulator/GNAT family N-acetyltransferase n=1 Tax=Solirhodobacter olei TaxID=2493082 RepID=UPI000FD7A48E|nr:helix-turn-helix domain-containing GNAT family N-acetyltransferase [Solirhodobacter olei]
MPNTGPAPDPADIARIRRFNRAVTREAGALDASFLGRGRPLGAARALCAIGRDGRDVSAVRAELGLDSGLMSRLLRGLEAEGLVTLAPDPADRRRRLARPTAAGLREIAAYDRLSDRRAEALLSGLGRTAPALLAAMDLVATALLHDRTEIAEADPAAPAARACLAAYYAELARRFEAGFDVTLSRDPAAPDMRPPRGSFLLALSDGQPVGCVGLKGDGGPVAEIKRLWIAPSARGQGLARRLMAAAEARARALGITTLRLDTNRALAEAIALYRRTGWAEVPAFNDEPYAQHWFEKGLD